MRLLRQRGGGRKRGPARTLPTDAAGLIGRIDIHCGRNGTLLIFLRVSLEELAGKVPPSATLDERSFHIDYG